MRFRDRHDAGQQLAAELRDYAGRDDVVLLGLARGGVPVARAVGDALAVAVDVLVVRKLGVPGQPELAFGAIATGGVRVLNPNVVAAAGLTSEHIDAVVAREQDELARREAAYGGTRSMRPVAIVVDDGLATGATMEAAVHAVRARGAQSVIAAAPVASMPAVERLRAVADDVRAALVPRYFGAVVNFYDEFGDVSDDDVRAALT